jgi:pantoate--beta-alanine ligase
MIVLKTVEEVSSWRSGVGGECVLVPTMGALHAGHASLVTQAASTGLPTIVSVFVNPTQFNDPADLARYPRTLETDVAVCAEAGARAVWAPDVEDVYPNGLGANSGSGAASPELPESATRPGLEDAHRPGHFAGVCQVVRRLFEVVRAKVAIFGEKDWQQLAVIRGMVEAERRGPLAGAMPTILAGPTVREADGLAMSSRNRFLTAEDRVRARAISRALRASVYAGTPAQAEAVMRDVLAEESIDPEYAVVRDAGTLGAVRPDHPARALIAARVGSVRLIDNAAWSAE